MYCKINFKAFISLVYRENYNYYSKNKKKHETEVNPSVIVMLEFKKKCHSERNKVS